MTNPTLHSKNNPWPDPMCSFCWRKGWAKEPCIDVNRTRCIYWCISHHRICDKLWQWGSNMIQKVTFFFFSCLKAVVFIWKKKKPRPKSDFTCLSSLNCYISHRVAGMVKTRKQSTLGAVNTSCSNTDGISLSPCHSIFKNSKTKKSDNNCDHL